MTIATEQAPTDFRDNELRASALLSHESVLELVAGIDKLGLRRLEEEGRFPKRMYVSPRRPVWRRREVLAYLADPEGWLAAAPEKPAAEDAR